LLTVTLVVGLKGAGGVVLASDSQATHGEIRESQTKLFKMKCGVIWGSAGPFSGTQDLYTALGCMDLATNPGREEAKAAIREAMLMVAERLPIIGNAKARFEALFAWYDAEDDRHYLLWATHAGHTEFERSFGSIGGVGALARFGFSRNEFLRFNTLPLETTKMVAYTVAEEVVKASSKGVDLPIQVAAVDHGAAHIFRSDELDAINNTANFFRDRQRDLLVTNEPPADTPRKGIRPKPR
jgi:20S proteasome alpha/beta subunit